MFENSHLQVGIRCIPCSRCFLFVVIWASSIRFRNRRTAFWVAHISELKGNVSFLLFHFEVMVDVLIHVRALCDGFSE